MPVSRRQTNRSRINPYTLDGWTVASLKEALQERHLPSVGSKLVLIETLRDYLLLGDKPPGETPSPVKEEKEDEVPAPSPTPKKRNTRKSAPAAIEVQEAAAVEQEEVASPPKKKAKTPKPQAKAAPVAKKTPVKSKQKKKTPEREKTPEEKEKTPDKEKTPEVVGPQTRKRKTPPEKASTAKKKAKLGPSSTEAEVQVQTPLPSTHEDKQEKTPGKEKTPDKASTAKKKAKLGPSSTEAEAQTQATLEDKQEKTPSGKEKTSEKAPSGKEVKTPTEEKRSVSPRRDLAKIHQEAPTPSFPLDEILGAGQSPEIEKSFGFGAKSLKTLPKIPKKKPEEPPVEKRERQIPPPPVRRGTPFFRRRAQPRRQQPIRSQPPAPPPELPKATIVSGHGERDPRQLKPRPPAIPAPPTPPAPAFPVVMPPVNLCPPKPGSRFGPTAVAPWTGVVPPPSLVIPPPLAATPMLEGSVEVVDVEVPEKPAEAEPEEEKLVEAELEEEKPAEAELEEKPVEAEPEEDVVLEKGFFKASFVEVVADVSESSQEPIPETLINVDTENDETETAVVVLESEEITEMNCSKEQLEPDQSESLEQEDSFSEEIQVIEPPSREQTETEERKEDKAEKEASVGKELEKGIETVVLDEEGGQTVEETHKDPNRQGEEESDDEDEDRSRSRSRTPSRSRSVSEEKEVEPTPLETIPEEPREVIPPFPHVPIHRIPDDPEDDFLEEVEYPMDTSQVQLDSFNGDLQLRVTSEARTVAEPGTSDGLALAWCGVKGSYGARVGKVAFQVRILDLLDVSYLPMEEMYAHDFRVGWSVEDAPLALGEASYSYAYCSIARKAENSVFKEWGRSYAKNDIVTGLLDFDKKEISYHLNEEDLGVAFEVDVSEPREGTERPVFFPHIASKNCKFEVNFGQLQSEWNVPLPEGFKFINNVGVENLVRNYEAPESKEDCTVLMMVGLPGCGKTSWVREYLKDHPEEEWHVISTDAILDMMKVNGVPREKAQHGRWDILMGVTAKAVYRMVGLACKKKKNYIIDQTNVKGGARKRRMMAFKEFRRKAVVMVPPDDAFANRRLKQAQMTGREVPPEAMLELKAEFALPTEEDGNFDQVIFVEPEGGLEEAQKLVERYNNEGKAWKPLDRKRGQGYGSWGQQQEQQLQNLQKRRDSEPAPPPQLPGTQPAVRLVRIQPLHPHPQNGLLSSGPLTVNGWHQPVHQRSQSTDSTTATNDLNSSN